jgi:hypothetical protein
VYHWLSVLGNPVYVPLLKGNAAVETFSVRVSFGGLERPDGKIDGLSP